MAARKGAVEGVKTMVSGANEFAHGLTLIGGALLVAGGLGAYVVDLRHQVKTVEKELKLVAMTSQKDIEVAKKETIEKFLTYGFAEEYSNYQKLLKLKQAQERNGELPKPPEAQTGAGA